MTKFQEIPWPRIVAEGAAIIFSILLAFWIQAWWEGRQQQGDEHIFLKALLDDLSDKRQQLEHDERYLGVIFESATTLLKTATDSDRHLQAGAIDKLIGNIVWYHNGDKWDSAPMSALAMGGDFVHVSDNILLRKLVELQNSIARLRGYYDNDKRFHYEKLTPFLMEHANLAQIYAAIEHTPGDPTAVFEFPEISVSSTRDHTALLSRDDFQGILIIKIDGQLDILRSIRTQHLEEQLEEIITMLEYELAN
jgi:hypothetical protein